MTTNRIFLALNILAFACGVMILADVQVFLRPWCAAILVLFGPGSGIVRSFRSFDTALRCVLVVAISLSCTVLVAEFLLAIGNFRTFPAAFTLTMLTALSFLLSPVGRSK